MPHTTRLREILLKLRPQLHQKFTQPIQPGTVATIAPVTIIGGMLNQFRIACRQQPIPQFRVLGKLGRQDFPHHTVLDDFPIRS